MRLIDADALPRHKQLEAMGNGKYEDVEVVYANDIDNAPTIDAVPIKHGRWDRRKEKQVCSLCGAEWYYHENDVDMFGYCPRCGALMDGGDD